MNRESVIVLREGDQFIALDRSSGGYPYLVNSPWAAEHWQSGALADAYRRKFPSKFYKWRIQEFRATFLLDLTDAYDRQAAAVGKEQSK